VSLPRRLKRGGGVLCKKFRGYGHENSSFKKKCGPAKIKDRCVKKKKKKNVPKEKHGGEENRGK